jgi:hypothetical protein
MMAVHFLLFLFFINVNNSFKIINYIHRKPHNTLFMGCDYYIEKRLCINYNDNSSKYINIDRERGYYSDYNNYIIDPDIENSNLTEWEKIKKYHLMPSSIPVLIYINNTFTDIFVSNEYKEILEHEMIYYDAKTWDHIKNIEILEKRYERD